MALKSRDELYRGTGSGSFSADDALPANNDEGGFLKNFPIVSIVTTALIRALHLRTIFYQTFKAFAHKVEDKASAADLGVDAESTSEKFVVVDQLPSVSKIDQDFTITVVPEDGMLVNNQEVLEITEIVTGKSKNYLFKFALPLIKLLIARTTSATTQSYYVDGNNGNDSYEGSILRPFKTTHWAAHKARQYSFTNNKPVTINVFGAIYDVLDTQVINTETVVGNHWIYGGWNFNPGVRINLDSSSGTYLFNNTTIPANQILGNMVVKGSLVFSSGNAGCIEHKTIVLPDTTTIRYSLDMEWLQSTTAKEFLKINKIGGSGIVPVTLKSGIAEIVGGVDNVSCIYTLASPTIFAKDCVFRNSPNSTVPHVNFDAAFDLQGIYCIFERCEFTSGDSMGQIRIGKVINILNIVDCLFTGYGNTSPIRENIIIDVDLTTGDYLRLIRNIVSKPRLNEIGTTVSSNIFIRANENAKVIALGNLLHSATLYAAGGKTLTTVTLDRSGGSPDLACAVVTGTVFPATISTDGSDNVNNAAYTIWNV